MKKIQLGRTVLPIYILMKCKYRNCDSEVGYGRIDKVYCSINCKRNEKKYRQRLKRRNEKINTRGIH